MRVLLIKMSSLGDVIHTLPALTDAARHGISFDWVVEEAFADIPAAHPAVNKVIPIAWRRWRKNLLANRSEMAQFHRSLREQSYDVVLDAQGLIKSAVVAVLARGFRHGFSHTVAREPWAAFAYAQGHAIARRQHAIDRQRQLFAAVFGYRLPHDQKSGIERIGPANLSQASTKLVPLLHGTTWQTKHWPVSMWRALARDIQAAGYEPVVTWGNDEERQRAEMIAQHDIAQVLPRMPLAELAHLLSTAAVVVGVDSGLCHLSAALGTPTVSLYGPTDGVLTGARGQCTKVITSSLECAPCMRSSCTRYTGDVLRWQNEPVDPPCFAEITPDRVWRAALDLLEQPVGDSN